MSEGIKLQYEVPGDDFTRAGEASGALKKELTRLGVAPEVIRKASIAMYEAEINMVIHAGGGEAAVQIDADAIHISLLDHGPGIPDISLAMREGFSTAPDNVRDLGFGAGMGLPNIRKYTDDMKIETEVGKGTTLYLKVMIA